MTNANALKNKKVDVIIVGAGPAGLGIAILLRRLGVSYTILEKDTVGSSFKKWPKETRFISPSFTGNFFRMPDLNAISPDTSPAFSLLTEHPTGEEYAQYLKTITKFYELHVETNMEVVNVKKEKNSFLIDTNNGQYKSKFLIWAAGEYQYPNKSSFSGANLCTHYSEIKSFASLKGKKYIVIGGYESGFDSAINLIKIGKRAVVLDGNNYLELVNSDSSYSLSPYTRDRIRQYQKKIAYHKKTRVKKVECKNGKYIVETTKNKIFTSKEKPINCTGFSSSLSLISDLFKFEENYPLLNNFDESTNTNNLFLVGPQVKHGNALFCFIYKYRQRFSIVAERIARKNKISHKIIENILQEYKDNNFYLKDVSCCDNECGC